MSQNLEWQAKIKVDSSDLRTTQTELGKTARSLGDVSKSATGFIVASSGMRDVLKGNTSGLITMGMGASMAWKAMSNLHPALKIVGIALAVAGPLIDAINKHFSKSSHIETFTEKLKRLGLVESDLKKLENGLKRTADALALVRDNADTTASAFKRLLDAQEEVANIRSGLQTAKIDLEERGELANPNLTESQRGEIKRKYAERRIDAETENRSGSIDRRMERLKEEDQRAHADQQGLNDDVGRKERMADMGLSAAIDAIRGVGSAGGKLNYDALWEMERRKEDGDLSGAVGMASIENLFTDIPEEAKDAAQEAAEAIKKALSLHDDYRGAVSRQAVGLEATSTRISAIRTEQSALLTEKEGLGAMAQEKKVVLEKEAASERQKQINAANASVREDISGYQYTKMTDTQKLAREEAGIGESWGKLAKETDPVERANLVNELVAQLSRRDSLASSIADRKENISEHKNAIEGIRESRSSTAMDTMGVFQHMYAARSGKNPDEQVAENTAKIKDHMAEIAELMKGQ